MNRLLASLLLVTACATAPKPSTVVGVQKPIVVEPIVAPKPAPKPELDRAEVRAKLAERRAIVFERFLAYRNARVYPLNRTADGAFHHTWVDAAGNLCAAATIISKDWGAKAVIQAGVADNGIALAKVTSGPLADWILTSGLTHHEIVAIQVPGWRPQQPPIGIKPIPEPVDPVRSAEINRLYNLYVDVERQLRDLGDESLELATDALMKRPDLAKVVLAGGFADSGEFGVRTADLR